MQQFKGGAITLLGGRMVASSRLARVLRRIEACFFLAVTLLLSPVAVYLFLDREAVCGLPFPVPALVVSLAVAVTLLYAIGRFRRDGPERHG
jgi:membrane protein required for beta-lactamase induction